jgi:hypothetical protein
VIGIVGGLLCLFVFVVMVVSVVVVYMTVEMCVVVCLCAGWLFSCVVMWGDVGMCVVLCVGVWMCVLVCMCGWVLSAVWLDVVDCVVVGCCGYDRNWHHVCLVSRDVHTCIHTYIYNNFIVNSDEGDTVARAVACDAIHLVKQLVPGEV